MEMINELNIAVELLKVVMNNPWLLLFFALFGLGYALKEYTSLNNKLIPIVIIIAGIALAMILIQWSLQGSLIGLVIGVIICGWYETLKNTFEYFIKRKKLISKGGLTDEKANR